MRIDLDSVWAKIGGGTFAFIPNIDFIKDHIDGVPGYIIGMTGGDYAAQIALRVVATALLAIIGGIFGLVGKELYTYKIKPKFIKWLKK